jgi:GntR family transcriptional regulator
MILNTSVPTPLYHQLANILLQKIRNGEYPPGSKIPSEPELARKYKVGRPTVRQATDILVHRRILTRKRGSGTFVCNKEEEIDLFSLAGTMSAFEKKGITLHRTYLVPISLIHVAEEKDNPFSGGEAYFFSRLSRTDDNPFLIEDMYLDPVLFPGIVEFDFTERSLSGIIEEHYGMRPSHGKQSFSAAYPDPAKSSLLQIPGKKHILFVKRYLHFRERENAIYSELYCKTDTFVFTQKIGGLFYD